MQAAGVIAVENRTMDEITKRILHIVFLNFSVKSSKLPKLTFIKISNKMSPFSQSLKSNPAIVSVTYQQHWGDFEIELFFLKRFRLKAK